MLGSGNEASCKITGTTLAPVLFNARHMLVEGRGRERERGGVCGSRRAGYAMQKILIKNTTHRAKEQKL